jgi:hypothetical protein
LRIGIGSAIALAVEEPSRWVLKNKKGGLGVRPCEEGRRESLPPTKVRDYLDASVSSLAFTAASISP